MPENEKQRKEKKKEILIGDSISLSSSVTIIRIRREAKEELDRLANELRQGILNAAVEVSKSTIHPYDVTLEDVKEAKRKEGIP